MANPIEYRGFTITNPGNGRCDWRCTFQEASKPRTRFGTIAEIKSDCDLVAEGVGLPPKERGFA